MADGRLVVAAVQGSLITHTKTPRLPFGQSGQTASQVLEGEMATPQSGLSTRVAGLDESRVLVS